jgi:hypothetical protein
MRFLTGGKPTPREVIRNETLPWFLHYYERFERFGFWAAIEKSTGDFVGWFEEHGEVEYVLHKADWEQREAEGGEQLGSNW